MSNTVDQYPFTPRVPRRLIVAGHWGRAAKQLHPKDAPRGARQGDSDIPVLTVPPVQDDKERGEGDSVNSRLHRLLAPRRKQ